MKSSTCSATGSSADKGGADKNVKTTHTNLAEGKVANSYISNDNFSQEVIFHYVHGQLPGHAAQGIERTLMSLGCGDSSVVPLHLAVE